MRRARGTQPKSAEPHRCRASHSRGRRHLRTRVLLSRAGSGTRVARIRSATRTPLARDFGRKAARRGASRPGGSRSNGRSPPAVHEEALHGEDPLDDDQVDHDEGALTPTSDAVAARANRPHGGARRACAARPGDRSPHGGGIELLAQLRENEPLAHRREPCPSRQTAITSSFRERSRFDRPRCQHADKTGVCRGAPPVIAGPEVPRSGRRGETSVTGDASEHGGRSGATGRNRPTGGLSMKAHGQTGHVRWLRARARRHARIAGRAGRHARSVGAERRQQEGRAEQERARELRHGSHAPRASKISVQLWTFSRYIGGTSYSARRPTRRKPARRPRSDSSTCSVAERPRVAQDRALQLPRAHGRAVQGAGRQVRLKVPSRHMSTSEATWSDEPRRGELLGQHFTGSAGSPRPASAPTRTRSPTAET